MDVKYLTYILEMANQKSITKAANALYISQPSLSQYLSKLEAELGTTLFIRTKNELLPTPAGELYIEAAKEVIGIQKQLYQNIGMLNQTGQIRVGITSTWALELLGDVIPKFKEAYPNITIKIMQNKYDSMMSLLAGGKIDFAVMAAENLDDFHYSYDFLRREEIMFAISKTHHLAKTLMPGQRFTFGEISNIFQFESFVLSDAGSTLRSLVNEMFKKYHFTPMSCCEVNSNSIMQTLVEKNIGVAFIPISYASRNTNIEYYHMEPSFYRNNIIAYRNNTVFSDFDRYFIELVKSHPMFAKNNNP